MVDLAGVSDTISPLHLRAIDEEPLGSNSKFFVQCKTRVWNTDHATGNAYCGGVVEGAWDADRLPAGPARRHRRAARRHWMLSTGARATG